MGGEKLAMTKKMARECAQPFFSFPLRRSLLFSLGFFFYAPFFTPAEAAEAAPQPPSSAPDPWRRRRKGENFLKSFLEDSWKSPGRSRPGASS